MGRDHGQAAVEFVVVIPLVLVIGMAGVQIVLAGHTWWQASQAAKGAARAVGVAVGVEDPDALASDTAASYLSGRMRRTMQVSATGGTVRVSTRVPLVIPWRSGGPKVSAVANFQQ